MGDFFSTQIITQNLVIVGNFLANLILDSRALTGAALARVEQIISEILSLDLGEISGKIEEFSGDVLAALSDQSDTFAQVVNGSESRIKDSILAGLVIAEQAADQRSRGIVSNLGNRIAGQTEVLNATQQKSTDTILGGLGETNSTLGSLSEIVLGGLSTLGGDLGSVVDVLRDGINTTINNSILIDESIFGNVIDVVTSTVRQGLDDNASLFTIASNTVKAAVTELASEVGEQLGELHPELRKVWQSITKQGEEANEIAEKVLDPGPEGTGGRVTRSVVEQLTPGLEETADQLQAAYVDFFGGPQGLDCLTTEERDLILKGVNVTGVGKRIIDIASGVVGPLFMVMALAQGRAQKQLHDWLACNPNQPLPPAETVLALQRGFITEADAQLNLQKQGWTADDSERLVNVGFTAPDLSLGYTMWLRGEISDDDLEHIFDMLGYSKSLHPVLKKLAFFIPPVQDLITMAVREVFTPEIAEAQGQFEDFPEDFAKFARQQGISEEWALNYWAAHWALPSVQLGFEMLHREVIDEQQLKTLMRALDIMPGWRDPLIAISFTPFTRVDIRRMHRLGVLTEAEVVRAYKDIGYDDEKSAKQLEFVLAANQEDDLLTLDVASDLTRSSILSFYADGIIGRTTARLLLLQAGINIAAAELFLLGADFDIERRDRKGAIDLVLDQFRFGGASLNESADRINGLGFESRERDLALLDLERLNQQETKLPSKADLDKFWKAEIIDSAEYVDQLERQGFSSLWANRYLLLMAGEN